jgi:hypothetical protein
MSSRNFWVMVAAILSFTAPPAAKFGGELGQNNVIAEASTLRLSNVEQQQLEPVHDNQPAT